MPFRITRLKPMIELSGVRSSWRHVGQELALDLVQLAQAVVGGLDFFQQADVLDDRAERPGQGLEQAQVGFGVSPQPAPVEHHHPDQAAAGQEGHHHQTAHAGHDLPVQGRVLQIGHRERPTLGAGLLHQTAVQRQALRHEQIGNLAHQRNLAQVFLLALLDVDHHHVAG
jgi:hypothetical protein